MPANEEIFEKVQATLVDALGVDEEEVTARSDPSRRSGCRVDRLPGHRFSPRAEFRDQDSARRTFSREPDGRPEWMADGKLTPKGVGELKARLPFADLSKLAADPDVEKMGDLYTVDMLVQYVQRSSLLDGVRASHGRDLRTRGRRGGAGASDFRSGGRPLVSDVLRWSAFSPSILMRRYLIMRWIWIDKFLEFRSGQFARAIKNLTLAEEHLARSFSRVTRSCLPRSSSRGWRRPAGSWWARRAGSPRRWFWPRSPALSSSEWPAPATSSIYEVTLTDLRAEGAVVEAKALLDGELARRRRDRLRPPGQFPRQPDLRPQEFRLHPATAGRPRSGQGAAAGQGAGGRSKSERVQRPAAREPPLT